jgi:hypothetical protein
MGPEGRAAVDQYLEQHGIDVGEVHTLWFQRTQTVVYGYFRTAGGHICWAPFGFDGPYPRVWRIPPPPEADFHDVVKKEATCDPMT